MRREKGENQILISDRLLLRGLKRQQGCLKNFDHVLFRAVEEKKFLLAVYITSKKRAEKKMLFVVPCL